MAVRVCGDDVLMLDSSFGAAVRAPIRSLTSAASRLDGVAFFAVTSADVQHLPAMETPAYDFVGCGLSDADAGLYNAIVRNRRAAQTSVCGCDALANGSPEARSSNVMRRHGMMVAQEFDAAAVLADRC